MEGFGTAILEGSGTHILEAVNEILDEIEKDAAVRSAGTGLSGAAFASAGRSRTEDLKIAGRFFSPALRWGSGFGLERHRP